ncbi:hypothetical protein BaRGS_00037830, partial [Batillaria attramentaria]
MIPASYLSVPSLELDGDHKETTVSVKWTHPSNYGSAANQSRRYRVTLSGEPNRTVTENRITYTGRRPGTPYNITVYTSVIRDPQYNTDRRTENTNPPSVTVRTKPAQPGKLLLGKLPGPDVTVQFYTSDGNVDTYTVNITNKVTGVFNSSTDVNITGNVASVQFRGLTPGVYYDVTIKATSGGIDSEIRTGVFRVATKPAGEVSGLTIDTQGSRWVRVTWSKPSDPNGDIMGYTVKMETGGQCAVGVAVICSNCSFHDSEAPDVSSCTENSTVEKMSSELETAGLLQVNVTGLKPYVSYTVKVAAYNEEGEGNNSSTPVETDQEAAANLKSLILSPVRIGELDISWTPDEVQRGRTNYTVYWERQTSLTSSVYTFVNSTVINGFENTQHVIRDLLSYWNYRVTVSSSTDAGPSPDNTTKTGRTMISSVPVNSNVTDRSEPSVTTVQLPAGVGEEPEGEARLSGDGNECNQQSGIVHNVTGTAERNYTFFVFAKTDGYNGSVRNGTFSTQAKLKKAETKVPTEDTITVDLCTCLVDDGQGEITFAALIVCRKLAEEDCSTSSTGLDVDSYLDLPTWKQFSEGKTGKYRTTPDDFHRSPLL